METHGNPVEQVAVELLTLHLPSSGLEVQVPVIKNHTNTTLSNQDHGLIPDIEVRPSNNSLRAGNDEQMDAAKTHLKTIL